MTTLNDLLIAAESNLALYKEDGDDRAIRAGEIMVMGIEAAIDYEKIYLKNFFLQRRLGRMAGKEIRPTIYRVQVFVYQSIPLIWCD